MDCSQKRSMWSQLSIMPCLIGLCREYVLRSKTRSEEARVRRVAGEAL